MKTKVITSVAVAWALTLWALAYADTNTGSTNISNWTHKMQKHTWSGWLFEGFGEGKKWWRWMKWGMWCSGMSEMKWEWMWMGGGMMNGIWMKMWGMTQLTDAEKAKLATMTDAEKKAFFEAKRTEMEAKMEAREAVMDKLVNWQTLTTDAEKAIQKEIINERAQMKKMREEMKTKMQAEQKSREEIKAIIEKKKSWATLTSDEIAKLLDAFVNKADQIKKPALANSWATIK